MNNSNDFVITKAGKLKKYKGDEKNIVVPDGIVEIEPVAFSNISGGPLSITLPEGLKKINYNAFIDCRNLININIPEGVTHIGSSAFKGCVSLENITIPNSIQKIEASFSSCTSLRDIVVPDYVVIREKCWKAFSPESKIKYCITNIKRGIELTQTESAFLKRSFTTAVEVAFLQKDIYALSAAFATKKKVSIDVLDSLLDRCDNLQEMREFILEYKNKNYSSDTITKHEAEQQNKEFDITQRSISEWRKIFKFPASPKDEKMTIDGYKSDDEVVVIPGKIGEYTVDAISSRAFKNMTKITEVVIENGISVIGVDAFLNCSGMKKLVLPETLTSIEWGAFARCVSLIEVSIPASVKDFSSGVFAGCDSLQSVIVAEGATIIGEGAFDSCASLKRILIPSSVTTIGFGAFFGCKNLTIYAPVGSYAETYAKENNIPFVSE